MLKSFCAPHGHQQLGKFEPLKTADHDVVMEACLHACTTGDFFGLVAA